MINRALLPPQPALVIVKPPKPFHILLTWDVVPGADFYRVYLGTNSIPNTRVVETTNNFATISNLWSKTGYEMVISAATNWDALPATEGSFSPVFHWPPAITNYLGFGISSNKLGIWNTNVVVTNPPNPIFCRLLRIPNVFTLQMSPDLKNWIAATNWAATNQPMDFYLHQSHWDNFNGHNFQKPD